MPMTNLPSWITPHLFSGKKYADLTPDDLQLLRERLSTFSHPTPEVSVVIPAWNEENTIFHALSSLADSETRYKTEIIVVNNNSTDHTQALLDSLGVRSYFQPAQGTPNARQMGLDKARGRYHLCADSDTFYPPKWIDLMVAPMVADAGITGVYGTYSFIPPEGQGRLGLMAYEALGSIFAKIRKRKREYLNVYGFNMGFVTEVGRTTGGFKVSGARVYTNVSGSDYQNEAEDGRMALNLKKRGRLKQVTARQARVFTSSRRLMDDGSIWNAFVNRAGVQIRGLRDYFIGASPQ
jgi:glycosyltransferase involved in cell wall biosynthesis